MDEIISEKDVQTVKCCINITYIQDLAESRNKYNAAQPSETELSFYLQPLKLMKSRLSFVNSTCNLILTF